MNLDHLEEIYESFCAFGSSRNLATGSQTNLSGSSSNVASLTMDNSKFAKFARETKILNSKVTSVDVDNAFVKVKPRTGRKIDFEGFQKALRILADKRFASKGDSDAAFEALVQHVCQSKGPKVHSIQPEATGIFEKLTDTKLYTGAHKARFDDNGVGRGLAGHASAEDTTKELSSLVSRDPAVKQKRTITNSAEALDNKPATKKYTTSGSKDNLSGAQRPAASTKTAPKSAASTKKAAAGGGGASVFDRLTDTSGYRGTHAQRFDDQGKGRGLAGRDSAAKGAAPGQYHGGDVKDLSQILRS